MRVALVTEGYPHLIGGVSTWCDQLVRGLPDVSWHVVTTGDGRTAPAFALPPNVASLTPVPGKGRRRPMADAAGLLCRGMLGDSAGALAVFAEGLRELAADPAPPAGPPPDLLLESWTAATELLDQPLPRLTRQDAETAAVLVEQALRPLAIQVPPVDLCHAGGTGLPALVALAAKWRAGVPFVLTEHRVHLRERYLGGGEHPPAVRVLLLRLHRALARLAYAEADLIAPVTAFNRRWEVRLGADPGRIRIIPNGADAHRFPPLPEEPAAPTIVWVGRIDPVKDLHTLLRAVALVRAQLPDTRLHLAGGVPPGQEPYARSCHALATTLGLDRAVTFAGPVPSSREAFAHGQVTALSSVSEGLPFALLEAMLSGRPVIGTDVGGVAELVGDTGLVVPPKDPAALAAGCVVLLGDAALRRHLAARARTRALAHFPLYRCLDGYREQYALLTTRCAA